VSRKPLIFHCHTGVVPDELTIGFDEGSFAGQVEGSRERWIGLEARVWALAHIRIVAHDEATQHGG
jgi:hypothetical protein